jgi:hypothetical protein
MTMILHRFLSKLLLLSCIIAVCAFGTVCAAAETGFTKLKPDSTTVPSAMAADSFCGHQNVQTGGVRGGLDQLYRSMEDRARSAAETNFTTIELAERIDFSYESETDTRIVGSATYLIHLRGSIIGRNRYVVTVRVRGELTRSGDGYSSSVLGSTVLSKIKK